MTLPPGPTSPSAWSTWRWIRNPYPYSEELRAAHGDTFSLRLLKIPLVVFTKPDDVKEVFADAGDDLAGGQFNRTLAPLLGDRSVLMVDGREHLRKRKLLLPPLQGERMQAYGQAMLDITDDAIDAFPYGSPFALHAEMQDITLRVIIRTVFGFDGPLEGEMVRTTKRVLELGVWPGLLLPFMQFDLGRLSPYGRFRHAVEQTDRLLYQEIARRRRDGTRGDDILSLLLDARDDDGQPMSADELRDELVTLLVAGHETTATAITWAIRWLLDSPELLRDLRHELATIAPSASAPAKIAKCELLDATAREALRLVPVIPLVGRVLTRDRTIGGYELRKGTAVVCSIYLAHRRADAFPNPDQFDPRRFLGKKPAPHEFLPFGGGVRRCIGMGFALYEMKMVLARLLTRTELEVAGPHGMMRRSITITPRGGLPVILRKRALRPEPEKASTAA